MRDNRFSHFLAIDWSGAKGPKQKGIALALASAKAGPPTLISPPANYWAREDVLNYLLNSIPENTLVGIDLGISLPFLDAGSFFPGWSDSPSDARSLWALVDRICEEDPHLECGAFLSHPKASQYFRHSREFVGEMFHLDNASSREGRFRIAEIAQRDQGVRPVSNFNLVGAAQVGKSSLTGMRMLNRISNRVCIWPFDPLPKRGPVIVEIYTAFAAKAAGIGKGRTKIKTFEDLNRGLAVIGSPPVSGQGTIDDHSSDALITSAWLRRNGNRELYWNPANLTAEIKLTEGWTFGTL